MLKRLKEVGTCSAISVLLLLLSGCAYQGVLTSYPATLAPIKAQLDSSSPEQAVDSLSAKLNSADTLLFAEEAGRAAQISGDLDSSIKYYQHAITAYQKLDDRALVSLSHVGANSSSFLVNDKVIPYEGNASERIMVHQYQALNFLFNGDIQASQVELRKTNELQTAQQNALQQTDKNAQQMASGDISDEVSRLQQLGKTPLNASSYYLTALLHELYQQPNEAYIDYRKAAELAPDNPALQQNLLRLADQLHMPQLDEFSARWGNVKQPQKTQGRLVVLVENGFVASKSAFSLTLPIGDNLMSMSLPTYRFDTELPAPHSITIAGESLNFSPLNSISRVEAAELSAKLPSIYTRQAARLVTKTSIANQTDGRTPGAMLGNALVQIFNTVTEQADQRSWLTLPAQIDVLDNFIEQGQYHLQYGANQQTVSIIAGKTTLVWVIDTGNMVRFYTKSL